MNKNHKYFLSLILSGTLLEWLEFIYFIQVANIIIHNFFPTDNNNYLYLLIISSYLSRPMGSVIFGFIGDKIGRKSAMLGALIIMALASLSMAILPTYQSIGYFAPVAIFTIRTMQCLSLPGEFTGAAIMTLEEPMFKNHRFYYMSFIPFAASCGMVLASLSSYIVNLPSMPSWAWRLPFAVSGILGFLAVAMRFALSESLEFKSKEKQLTQKNSTFWLAFTNVFLFAALISVWVYIGNVFYKNFFTLNTQHPQTNVTLVVTMGQLLTTIFIIIFGKIADKFNAGKLMCKIGLGLAVILAIPMTLATTTTQPLYWYLSQLAYSVVNGLLSATLFTLTFKEFAIAYRFRASSIAWNLSSAIFGSSALFIGMHLNTKYPGIGPGIYISIIALLTWFTFNALMRQKN
ncbi:MAG: MFS transporter [Francisellaceae bacterium]|jgi:MFS transporter, MHS family, proline/betaine transporter|nr:MFS transporter [Francisellaceae bacterium]MBT6539451.1 MFS transporter [Francisellaceae bacterium]